ncbi:Methionyl-tRNA formyltransferase, partial [termite gut metagenome]
AASDGFIAIRSLQLPGKKRLETVELLRGFAWKTKNEG